MLKLKDKNICIKKLKKIRLLRKRIFIALMRNDNMRQTWPEQA